MMFERGLISYTNLSGIEGFKPFSFDCDETVEPAYANDLYTWKEGRIIIDEELSIEDVGGIISMYIALIPFKYEYQNDGVTFFRHDDRWSHDEVVLVVGTPSYMKRNGFMTEDGSELL